MLILNNLQVISNIGFTNFIHTPVCKSLIAPHPHQDWKVFDLSHSIGQAVMSCCDFKLYFPDA